MKILISTSHPASLRSKLSSAGVPVPVINAIGLAVEAGNLSRNSQARAYAGAMELSFDEYGLEGVKHQIAYMLLYLGIWQGDIAKATKKLLKKWSMT